MTARIALVVAMAENRVIGRRNALPWRLPADLKHFRALTLGKPVLMGRKTFESIGRPLPGRTNIVVTGNPAYHADGCLVVPSLAAGLARFPDVAELMVIGGATIYREALPAADRIYLTLIHQGFEGDTVFPDYLGSDWREVERRDFKADADNPYDYSFLVLDRVGRAGGEKD